MNVILLHSKTYIFWTLMWPSSGLYSCYNHPEGGHESGRNVLVITV